jgi:Protein of unknown function (DUF751)
MQKFFDTISKYPILLAGAFLAILLDALGPLSRFTKNPITAIALIGFFVSGLVFITFTLRAMFGIS